jgi:hypothetical protein
MKMLSRKSPSAAETYRKSGQGRRVHRRIEITVEREIVSVLVRSPQPGGPVEPELPRRAPEPSFMDPTGPD